MPALFPIFPATVLAVAGYLVLYAALRSTGTMQAFGRVLAAWTFLLSAFMAIAAIVAPFFGMPLLEFGDTPNDRRLRHDIRIAETDLNVDEL